MKELVIRNRMQAADRVYVPPDARGRHDAAEAYGSGLAFVTSAAAKLIAAAATYPHEVLRTRMREHTTGGQRRYRGVLQSTRLILAEEGLRGLYGGMGVHMVRTVPNAAILLMVVERIVGGEV
jgi:hypothetical protein